MPIRRWGMLGVLLSSLLALGQAAPPLEDECWESFEAFRDGPWATRFDGAEARDRLLEALEELAERHRASAPRCEGRLFEYRTFLLVLEGRYMASDSLIHAYLNNPRHNASASLRLRLLRRRGYALERMGEIRESSQQYFAAAALANEADAVSGVQALISAAISADLLEDPEAEERYLNEATRLIADSLQGRGEHARYSGQVLMSRTGLLEDRIRATADGSERRRLARRLQAVSDRALALLPDVGMQDVGHRARVMGSNALALAVLGRHDEARRVAAPILDLARRSQTMVPNSLYYAWDHLSQIAEAEGDLDAARHAVYEAQREALALGNGVSERSMMRRLGHLAELERDWEGAANAYADAIAAEETYRERLGLQDWTRQAFSGVDEAYRGLVRTHLEMDAPEAAFLNLDRTRARYLRDLRRHLEVRARLTPADRVRADRIQTELDSIRQSLASEELRGVARATVTVQISELQERLEILTGSAAEAAPDLETAELQEALGQRGQVLVSYFLDARGSTAFVVRPDTFAAVPLATTPADVEALLRDVGTPWRDEGGTDPAFNLDALHLLYREVVAPVMPWLEGASSIVIVPDGALAGVPFGMLVTEPAEDYGTAKYLVRDVAVTTELAASMVPEAVAAPSRGPMPLDLLAFGRTDFDTSGFTWNGEDALSDLAYVDDEVERIGRGIEAREVALNEEATESHLMRRLPEARIVHLASHAEPDPELPLYSKIALWEGRGDDGVLYLYELQSQALNADLVVLSGCSTARGVHQSGEGMFGLQYAVRTAGARASLATLWPVDDRASVELMSAFYDGLKKGLSKGEALQRAQIAYLDTHDGLSASPFYWAAPILSGDTAPVPLTVTNRGPWWIVLGLVLVGAGVAWHLRRRRLDA